MTDITQRLLVERRQRQDAQPGPVPHPRLRIGGTGCGEPTATSPTCNPRQRGVNRPQPVPPVAPQPGACQRHAEALLLWPGAILPIATHEMQTRPGGEWTPVCLDCLSQIQGLASRYGALITARPIKK